MCRSSHVRLKRVSNALIFALGDHLVAPVALDEACQPGQCAGRPEAFN